ncbi:MAG: hypothetical protein HZB91_12845 [Elusimicrobia bacterium]|nr:hypothetical protein [Elusimicrobiota bacterium]
MKPQDVLILLQIACWKERDWLSIDLARELRISTAEVSMALERTRRAGLLDRQKRKVVKAALLEFVLHAVKYVFPAEPGPLCRGIPTAHSAQPLAKRIVSEDNDQYVWPHDDGDIRGQAISPLYKTAPDAARKDRNLYELLALIDALRVGRARERTLAAQEIERRLSELLLENK